MNLAEFHFIRPYWLFALMPWFVVIFLMVKHKLSLGNWSTICDEALLPYILEQKAVNRSRAQLTAGACAGLLTILALAGPTWERLPSPVFRNDSAVVIALDLSRSMDAADIKPSRLIRARYKIADILKKRKDGQTALLVYAGDAFTVTPLTDDNDTITNQLSTLTTDIMPSQGSNTGLALNHAIELLKNTGLQKGNILLVTDGVDADSASKALNALGQYKLSVLAVGTEAGAPIKAPQGGFVKDRQGNIVVPKLIMNELQSLAAQGKGITQKISANDSDIQKLMTFFDSDVQEQGSEKSDLLLEQWAEYGSWLLFLVVPLAALSFRKGVLSLALFVLLPWPESSYALTWEDLWKTRNQQGQKAFESQQYGQAAENFTDPEWKAAAQYKAGQYEQTLETLKDLDSAVSHYNQGNALTKSGQLAEAIKAYDKALKLDPDFEDAEYNKKRVEEELKKQQEEEKQQQQEQNQEGDDQQKSKEEKQENKDGDSTEQQEGNQEQEPQKDPADSNPSEQREAEKKQSQQDQQQTDEQKAKEAEAQRAEEKESEENEAEDEPSQALQQPVDETQQANEQWLNRIPDDPSGLLKRKFRYQYGQRGRKSGTQEGW